ncbi:unnamed protein product [Closterium sp. Naga37s-1]|nr:unnamed protein product [Closterium sp. Naga37s-1]
MSLAARQSTAAASLSASLCHSQDDCVERASVNPAASAPAWQRHNGLRMVSTGGGERRVASAQSNQRTRSHKRAQARAAVSTALEQAASAGTPLRPLRVMISGAPASGKGTQCELIVAKQYGLTHISAGDLLRAEVAAGTEGGRQAKTHMDAGRLVPDDVVVTIVKNRLAQEDAQSRGWLLDGYPRSLSQAQALLALDISPDVFILLDVSPLPALATPSCSVPPHNLSALPLLLLLVPVLGVLGVCREHAPLERVERAPSPATPLHCQPTTPFLPPSSPPLSLLPLPLLCNLPPPPPPCMCACVQVPQEILVERVVGRRLDPATNRIYHLSFSPPESEEIAARLTQRSDDTEEKVKARLETHNANVASVLDVYAGKLVQVNGHRGKEEVFGDIDSILTRLQQGQLSFD